MAIRIPDEFIRQVHDRTQILPLVGAYVELRKAGARYKGLCPFHQEKTPSFFVDPDRGFYHCFGCGRGGDAIRFVMEMQGHSFVEAVETLAERAGLKIPEAAAGGGDGRKGRGAAGRPRVDRRHLVEANRRAQAFFREQAAHCEGFRSFLDRRGLTEASAEAFGLGFAPDTWDALAGHLRLHRIEESVGVAAGVLVARSDGRGAYDRFRNRITFPVRDLGGDVVAFSGRTLSADPEAAKYVNSPESAVYRKGKMLYGLDPSRAALRGGASAVIVEGNVDVVRLHSIGLDRAVAPLGTALTPEQAARLARFSHRAIIFYDGDSAGAAATLRAIPVLMAAGLDVAVVRPPEGKDPADLAAEGLGGIEAVLDRAQDALCYLVDALLAEHGRSDAGVGRVLEEALHVVAQLPEEAAAIGAAWTLHRLLGLERRTSDADLRRRVARERRRPGRLTPAGIPGGDPAASSAPGPGRSTLTVPEQAMAALLLRNPDYAARFADEGGLGLVADPLLRSVLGGLAETGRMPEEPEAQRVLATELLFSIPAPDEAGGAVEPEYLERLARLESESMQRRQMALQADIARAEQSGDAEALRRLREEKVALLRARLASAGREVLDTGREASECTAAGRRSTSSSPRTARRPSAPPDEATMS